MDAKETEYKGYRFRSRLEARWAVFFDALDIDYEYEPEGFVLSNKQTYLPDFYLPFYNVYVEVKHKDNIFISHPDDNTVTFGEYPKYGFFMHEATAKGYGVWFVFGDPMDAMLDKEHGGKGTNELFCNCECVLKAFESNNNKICSCGGKTLKVSECDKKMIVSGKVAALDKEFMITVHTDKDITLEKGLLRERANFFIVLGTRKKVRIAKIFLAQLFPYHAPNHQRINERAIHIKNCRFHLRLPFHKERRHLPPEWSFQEITPLWSASLQSCRYGTSLKSRTCA